MTTMGASDVWSQLASRVLHVGIAMLMLQAATSAHVRADEPKRASDAEIIALIDKLGNDSFDLREKASFELHEIGEPALERLRLAAKQSKDAETRWRSRNLVVQIERVLSGLQKTLGDSNLGGSFRQWGTRAAVIPTTSLIAVARHEELRVWDLATDKQVHEMLDADGRGIWSLAASAQGDRIIAGGNANTIPVFDVKSGKRVALLEGHTASVWGVALSADGKHAISASRDKSIRFWDVDQQKVTRQLDTQEMCRCLAVSPDGKLLATAHFTADEAPSLVRIWDIESAKLLHELKGHSQAISSVLFAPDGRRLVTGSFDTTVRIWEIETEKELKQLSHKARVEAIAITPDGTRIVSGTDEGDGAIHVFNTETGECVWNSEPIRGGVMGMAMLPSGKEVVTVGKEQPLQLWALKLNK